MEQHRSRIPPPFLEDKLVPPVPPVAALARPRLVKRLNAATTYRVTALSAPAGSGKSTLLADWAATVPRGRLAWLSLDDSDNTPMVFWAYVLAALRRPTAAGSASFARLDVPEEITESFLDNLLAQAGELREDLTLVLDDVHRLRNPLLLKGFERLLRHAPRRLHFVLSGRTHPDLPLARLRVAGNLIDIGPGELACVPDEAAAMLRLLGVQLSDAEVEHVVRETDGWITGLRLAALWWHAEPPDRRDITTFSGRTAVVADYLDDEILGGRDQPTRQFLLRTCLVDTICGDLADHLTGRPGGARTLDELAREEALVTAIDPDREWFRYNPLLREFLQAKLTQEQPSEPRLLRRRAALWYAENDLIGPALAAAADAKDWMLVSRLLIASEREAVASIEPDELDALLARIPDQLVRNDRKLALAHAGIRLAQQDPDAAEPFLRIVELATRSGGAPSLPEELRRTELRLHQGMLRGQPSISDLDRADQLMRHAEENPDPAARVQVAALAFRLGMCRLWNADAIAARQAFQLAVGNEPAADSTLRSRSAGWLDVLNAADGRLSSISQHARGAGPLPALARAIADYARDRLDVAWAALRAEWLTPESGLELPLVAFVRLLRSRILAARGEFGAALAELVPSPDAAVLPPPWAYHASLVEASILLDQEDVRAAGQVLRAAGDSPTPGLAAEDVLLGRLYLAEHEPAAALTAVQPCLHGTAKQLRLIDTVAAHLVSATAHRAMRNIEQAKQGLDRALELAEPEGLVRVFLDAGRNVRSLLTVLVPPHGQHSATRMLLLQHFELQASLAGQPRTNETPALTRAEQQVLRYLPSRMTNQEIGADLFLSVNTVKTHLRTLYRKLGVGNRREAIARAQQLGLLD